MNQTLSLAHSGHMKGFIADLVIYISVMFLIRELYFSQLGFIVNGLFWSLSMLIAASWKMKVRKVSWKELGLFKPKSFKKNIGISFLILFFVIISIIAFEFLKDNLFFTIIEDSSSTVARSLW